MSLFLVFAIQTHSFWSCSSVASSLNSNQVDPLQVERGSDTTSFQTAGVVRKINLQTPFDNLDNSYPRRDDQHQDCHPERVPLHAVPAVMEPHGNGARRRIVVGLLQNHQPVAPKKKPLD